MSDLFETLPLFHFIRPWWLVLIPLAATLWWRIRSRATAKKDIPSGLAPHLAAALTIGSQGRGRILAIDGVMLIVILTSLAASGPTWSRVPNPLVAQTAPLAIVLEVSETMLADDVAPSRLERAKYKILDLVAARAGARTALIAYAGSAHRAVPLTEDPEVLKPFLEGLVPDVMPVKGQNATTALELARASLEKEAIKGAILFVLDDLDRADFASFEEHAKQNGPRIVFLSMSGSDQAITELSGVPGSAVVTLTPDGSDVAEIERRVASAYRDAFAQDERQQWQDQGWLLAWPAALLVLLWFRRGWTMRWSIVILGVLGGLHSGPAKADGIADWFLTADQQGRLVYEDRDFTRAADLFSDPMWKGYVMYRAGRYAEAVQTLARVKTPDATVVRGLAHIRNRQYREGITAFEEALAQDPAHSVASRNLEVARAILEYVEGAREQSDTGDRSEGADDIVFDKEKEGGTEVQISRETEMKMESADQWMRTVDTRTTDFLRIRFGLEAARAKR